MWKRIYYLTGLFVVALVSLSNSCAASIMPSRILPAIFVGVDEDGGEPEIVSVGHKRNVMIQGGAPPLRLIVGPVRQDGDYLTAECVVEGGTESFSIRVDKREPMEVVCEGVRVHFSAGVASTPEYSCGWLLFHRVLREKRLQETYEHRMNKEKEEAAVAKLT